MRLSPQLSPGTTSEGCAAEKEGRARDRPNCRLPRTWVILEMERGPGVSGSVCQHLGVRPGLAEERRGGEGREGKGEKGQDREEQGG